MRLVRAGLALVAVGWLTGVGLAEKAVDGAAQVTFAYENAQLQPAKYVFVLREDGTGHFHSEPGPEPIKSSAAYQPLPQEMDRDIQFSAAFTARVFSTARGQKLFNVRCEDTKDKVAYQGKKQLSYQGPDGAGECIYNWSKLVPIQQLTRDFESAAFALEEGRRIALEHKHDRLSLDAEVQVLAAAVKDGRATELQNIRPELEAVVADEAVMERARSTAGRLLGSLEADRASR